MEPAVLRTSRRPDELWDPSVPGLAGHAVHKCHWFGQKHLEIFDESTPINTVELFFIQRNIKIPRNFVGYHETGIMPGFLITGTGIPEADNQSQI